MCLRLYLEMKGGHYCDDRLTTCLTFTPARPGSTDVPYLSGQYLNSSTPHVSLTFARLYWLYGNFETRTFYSWLCLLELTVDSSPSLLFITISQYQAGTYSTFFRVNMSNEKDAPKSTLQIWSGETFLQWPHHKFMTKVIISEPEEMSNRQGQSSSHWLQGTTAPESTLTLLL